jgi:antitoxin PrlF
MKNNYATITSKGQITIPSAIRNKMHLSSGSKLEFIQQGEHILIIPINKSVKSLKGMLPKPDVAFSIEEMNKIIKDKYDRN